MAIDLIQPGLDPEDPVILQPVFHVVRIPEHLQVFLGIRHVFRGWWLQQIIPYRLVKLRVMQGHIAWAPVDLFMPEHELGAINKCDLTHACVGRVDSNFFYRLIFYFGKGHAATKTHPFKKHVLIQDFF